MAFQEDAVAFKKCSDVEFCRTDRQRILKLIELHEIYDCLSDRIQEQHKKRKQRRN